MVGTSTRPRGIRVRFAQTSEEEFLHAFCFYCEKSAVFAPTDKMIPAGSDCAFSLELPDGTPMLRGLGTVIESYENDLNRFSRRGVYIGFSQLTTTSEVIHARLLAARSAADTHGRTSDTRVPPGR